MAGDWDVVVSTAAAPAVPKGGGGAWDVVSAVDAPRWDVVGDTAKAFTGAVDALKEDATRATQQSPRKPGETFAGMYGRHLTELPGGFKAALSVPVDAMGAAMSPFTGAVHGLIGSALSYAWPGDTPGEKKQRADAAIDTAMMGVRPGKGPGSVEAAPPAQAVPPKPGAPQPASRLSLGQALGKDPTPPPAGPVETAPASPMTDKAISEVVKRLEQDTKGGGRTPQEILEALRDLPKGAPIRLVDLAGENTRGLAGNVGREIGPSREIAKKSVAKIDETAPDRLRSALNTALGDGSAYEAGTTLMQQRKAAAAPLYAKFEAAPPMPLDAVMPTGQIGSLLGRPSMRKAMKNAIEIAKEEGVDARTLGIDLDEAGEPRFVQVPTWRTMDLVKRGIDDVVEESRDKVTGKLVLDNKGRGINSTRAELVQAIDKLNPAYAEAREAWGGPSQSLDSIRFGRDALANEPEENAARLKSMSPADQEFARIGLKADLLKKLEKSGANADESKKIAGSDYVKRQIRPFFRSDAEAKEFLQSVHAEALIFRTNYELMGNSRTAGRVAEDMGTRLDALKDAAGAGKDAITGNLAGMAHKAFQYAGKLMSRPRSPEVNAEIARLLYEPLIDVDGKPTKTMQMLEQLIRHQEASEKAKAYQRSRSPMQRALAPERIPALDTSPDGPQISEGAP